MEVGGSFGQTPKGTRLSPLELQALLSDLVEAARHIETRSFEHSTNEVLGEDLFPEVEEILTLGLDTFGVIFEHYEGGGESAPAAPAPSGENFYRSIDRVLRTGHAAQRIADLCFMARLELRSKQEQLKAVDEKGSVWSNISACASVRRKVIKSASAIEKALCEHEGLLPSTQSAYETEVQRSLLVRRTYSQFRRAVTLTESPPPDAIQQKLRHAGIQIAKLVGRDIYEDMRIDDRIQLRALQDAMVAWMRGGDSFTPRSGLRLLQDLSAFAGMLVLINNRAVLREHDAVLVNEVLEALQACAADEPLPEELLARLRTIQGRDDELDRFIDSNPSPSVGECRELLRRLQTILKPPTGTEAFAPDASESEGSL
jgi:hypothetical protein